jgi:hypothetical protein
VGTDGFGAATLEDRNVDIGRNMENTNDSLMPSYCRRFAAIGMVVALILCLCTSTRSSAVTEVKDVVGVDLVLGVKGVRGRQSIPAQIYKAVVFPLRSQPWC